MEYKQIQLAYFLQRKNRFVACCRLIENNEVVDVHVKNTGRGREVLVSGAIVALNFSSSIKRKTAYDLVAVKKQGYWYNIDSSAPNEIVYQALLNQTIVLPGLKGSIAFIKREATYDNSRIDFYFETEQAEKGFIEVKGMTLENERVGAFPDAPTARGLKHVRELLQSQTQGMQNYVIFVAQFALIEAATIHEDMQPELQRTVRRAIEAGVHFLCYASYVSATQLELTKEVPFVLDIPFKDPLK
ncbi:DNA/RNA nuclease SfsA [Tetragenococcus muriaticus]|uniref:Sugar fermentation stimulation protein homolog n=2 Tax=Tetragenococcus muriaticus TaxID=64642 RepID=A0A091CCK5_9ENTE|nr:DNA/RNA nuclease SfsA [Tetragenococcus muriaticus]KFN90493.1 sugar/maltose fermentation stimulation protein [Tetragenococcus muriaticus 3MR10-3]KFN90949.1 sugar/maltose fermentation stimulation protein [Tetragenococcus muriaticus PMC-11-5]GMA45769.1 sugar fermentation stimulation protein [Tetragenococcus muriaticus]GMA46860.1 sugar fermentation stimulation protein [Tetragenococcus muriaticus]